MTDIEQAESSEDGFTLIELLVAIALLALMATYALNALSYMQNFDRIINRIERQGEVEATARHLRQTLADARAVFGNAEAVSAQIEFEGRADSLELITVLNRDLAAGGLFRLRYGLQPETAASAEQGSVFAVWRQLFRPNVSDPDKAGQRDATVLMDGVESLRFRYFGSNEPEEEPVWLDTWPKGEILPALISLDVVFPNGDVRRWPQLVIPIQASQ
jgi:prepilin-type N-terminal cleavage/methylation domain-containing protein